MPRFLTVEGIRTHGPNKGKPVRCVIEAANLKDEREAVLFGAGLLRGMGFGVKDVKIIEAPQVEGKIDDEGRF